MTNEMRLDAIELALKVKRIELDRHLLQVLVQIVDLVNYKGHNLTIKDLKS
jgi:hypothetical protein